MKLVKLNRRFRQFKEHGHTVALRFDTWSQDALKIEAQCRSKLGGSGWVRSGRWTAYRGKKGDGRFGSAPVWISFRNESDVTLVLLCTDLTETE